MWPAAFNTARVSNACSFGYIPKLPDVTLSLGKCQLCNLKQFTRRGYFQYISLHTLLTHTKYWNWQTSSLPRSFISWSNRVSVFSEVLQAGWQAWDAQPLWILPFQFHSTLKLLFLKFCKLLQRWKAISHLSAVSGIPASRQVFLQRDSCLLLQHILV